MSKKSYKYFYLFPWLIFLWPALSIFAELPYAVDANFYGYHLLMVATFALLLNVFSWLAFKVSDWSRYILFFISISLILLFLYNPMMAVLSGFDRANVQIIDNAFSKKLLLLTGLFILIIVNALYYFKKTSMKHLVILLLVLNTSSLVGFILNGLSWDSIKVQQKYYADSNLTLKAKPNIYFLLMDAYPGMERLKEINYDNRLFFDQIKKKGFFVHPKFRSNYPKTLPSMHSMFNMTLNKEKFSYDNIAAFANSLAGDNRWHHNLKNNGYHTFRVSELRDFYSGHGCFYNQCYSPGFSTVIGYLRTTKIGDLSLRIPILRDIYGQLFKLINYDMLNKSLLIIDEVNSTNQPIFLYAHYQITHVERGVRGSYTWYEECIKKDYQGNDYNRRYVASMECANDFYLKMINTIEHKDPEGIIILISDHGQFIEGPTKFSALYASKLPKQCQWVNTQVQSSVNLLNYVQACLSNSVPENGQPDNSYGVDPENSDYIPVIIDGKIVEN